MIDHQFPYLLMIGFMSGIFFCKRVSAACAVALIYNAFVSNHVLPKHNIEDSGRLKSVRAVSNMPKPIAPWVVFCLSF